jgi:hypothetical protein
VKVDVTLHEAVVRPLERRPVVRGYDEYEDLPGDALVGVYSLDEIAIEKMVALGDRARNEPRDLYDLWFLISNGHVDPLVLRPDLEAKLAFRGRTLDSIGPELVAKEARLRSQWVPRLGRQMSDLPGFDGVFREVKQTWREAGLI